MTEIVRNRPVYLKNVEWGRRYQPCFYPSPTGNDGIDSETRD